MTSKFFPEALYENGFTDLIPVIPPGAPLTPSSKIPAAALGKVPGRKLPSGMWAGFDWRKLQASADDVRQWCLDGANVGLRSDRFPGVDVDCTDEALAQIIHDAVVARLGPAPIRVGRAPKRLFMYRTDEPFSRMRLAIRAGEASHLVEILGRGQQYLVYGTHPATLRPYTWDTNRFAYTDYEDMLCEISRETASAFLDELAALLETLGYTATRVGDGSAAERGAAADQPGLRAPSIEQLAAAVAAIPNNDDLFPVRDDYVRMGYAIRAAAGEENEDDGYEIFASWAGRHEKDGRVSGNPETWRSDWRRFDPPYSVGWGWIAEQARRFGHQTAELEFDIEAEAPPNDAEPEAPLHSDQWLAEKIVQAQRGVLRYLPQREHWLVWDSARWRPDAVLLAEDVVKKELKRLADRVARQSGSNTEKAQGKALAAAFCSAGKATAVAALIRSDRSIAVDVNALDHDQWKINTPGGIIDLKTGTLGPVDPDALCTKSTAVPPAFGVRPDRWLQFLQEATGGKPEVAAYLQRLCGYCLTGSTREQHLTFVWGPGGTGKTVFMGVLSGILADYHHTASMDTFTESHNERHPTDIAAMVGARLVTASETAGGKRWDEQRVKHLTGGERVSARFMRQDEFTFKPQLKLLFIGNHRPAIRDVDKAMRRRFQLVHFNSGPATPDLELPEKLQAEWPAILAWMVEGCLAWQREGLNPPPAVLATTEEYFEAEDAIGRWLTERCEIDKSAQTLSQALFDDWREWAGAQGEYVGSLKRLSSALASRHFEKWQHPTSRRKGFAGIRLKDRQDIVSIV